MGIERVFKSTHPEVIAVVEEWKQAAYAFRKNLSRWLDQHNAEPVWFKANGTRPARMVGLTPIGEAEPPLGWRENKNGYWVPDKRRIPGKEAQKQMDSTTCISQLKILSPFIPVQAMAPGHWYAAGVNEIDGVVYITHTNAFTFEGNEYFEPIKLSEYYAAIEVDEAK